MGYESTTVLTSSNKHHHDGNQLLQTGNPRMKVGSGRFISTWPYLLFLVLNHAYAGVLILTLNEDQTRQPSDWPTFYNLESS